MKKNKILVAYVEEPVFEAFNALADRQDSKVSSLIRGLIIKDLVDKGLLPAKTMERLVTS